MKSDILIIRITFHQQLECLWIWGRSPFYGVYEFSPISVPEVMANDQWQFGFTPDPSASFDGLIWA